MATYVLLTRLGSDVLNDPRGRQAVAKEWKRRVKKICPQVKWRAHYALLGRYDFMDIYEAPDAETAAAVSLLSRCSGAVFAESLPALGHDTYVAVADRVESEVREETEPKRS